MRQDSRLKKLERHPETLFKQELQRLQEQEAKALFEVTAAVMQAAPDKWDTVLHEVTDAQLLHLMLDSELPAEEKERVEEALNKLPGLTAEAWRNVELLLSPPPSTAEYAKMKQELEFGLQRLGVRPMTDAERELREAARKGMACL